MSKNTSHPVVENTAPKSPERRNFMSQIGGAAAATVSAGAVGIPALLTPSTAEAAVTPQGPLVGSVRALKAYSIREAAARYQLGHHPVAHPDNGDEQRYANKLASYSKGLPHDQYGEVDLNAYHSMKNALVSGLPVDFEAIQLTPGGRKLTNPQAGLAFDLEGADSHALTMRPAPTFASAENAGEIVENYWMALLRDVPFEEYDTHPDAAAAVADLNRLKAFRGPRENGLVTPQTLFRANFPGAATGPWLSQFLCMECPYGSNNIEQKIRTTAPGVDYMTDPAIWAAVQNGLPQGPDAFAPSTRYMISGRDIGQWVHVDVLWQAYFMACLVMDSIHVPLNETNPYNHSATQAGFATFGPPGIKTLLVEVATRALKAVWYQKWYVHLRERPEAFAGHVHFHLKGQRNYPIHSDVLNSDAVQQVASRHSGNFFLPMAFPEGSPTHPAYGAGHATVAGACVTIIKAFYDGSYVIPNPIVASNDGSTLLPYSGPALTVEGELNKVAANVAFGRNIAGVHWRSDGDESLKLGEQVAIKLLKDTKRTFNEKFSGFQFKGFNGNTIAV